MVQLQTGRGINSKFIIINYYHTLEESLFALSVGKKKSKGTHLETWHCVANTEIFCYFFKHCIRVDELAVLNLLVVFL